MSMESGTGATRGPSGEEARPGQPDAAVSPRATGGPRASRSEAPGADQVHVAPNLAELVGLPQATREQKQEAIERRDLNHVVHSMLTFGLTVSTVLMLVGLSIDFLLHRDFPSTLPDLRQVVARVAVGRPSGFYAMGVLVLIATPILRVIGSIAAFVFERDWAFTAVTAVVFLVVMLSVYMGRG